MKLLLRSASLLSVLLLFSAGMLTSVSPVLAFDMNTIRHTPPRVEAGDEFPRLLFQLDAPGIRRVRALVVREYGYQTVPLIQAGSHFEVRIDFEDQAELSYQFQLETDAGEFIESDSYSVRLPADRETEAAISGLQKQMEARRAQLVMLNRRVEVTRSTDPATLERQRERDMAKYLVILGQREREYATRMVAANAAKVSDSASQGPGVEP